MPIPFSPAGIVFDAYGTLFDVSSLDKLLSQYFGDRAIPLNEIWRRKQLEYTWLRGLMEKYEPFSSVTADALSYACKTMGLALPEDVKAKMVQGYYELAAYAEVISLVPKLSTKYNLYILSNADPAMLHAAVQNSALEKYFSGIFSVDRVKKYKPHPAVYQVAVDELKTAPRDILFISSNTWDVAGAKSFGLSVAWLDRGKTPMEELGPAPNLRIKKLEELL